MHFILLLRQEIFSTEFVLVFQSVIVFSLDYCRNLLKAVRCKFVIKFKMTL